tara:strand:+ start:1142 stop:1441 length:300 start_codon:yes stop_codon:yes gene_type:complete
MKKAAENRLDKNEKTRALFVKNVVQENIIGKARENRQCKECSHRTTLKSGTVMENSKLSFQYWFIGMHFLSSTTKTFSAKEIQNQLGHNRYQPTWEILH